MKQFAERSTEWWEGYTKAQDALRHPLRQVRVRRRRASDGMLNVNMNALFEDRLKPTEFLRKTKIETLRKNPGRDQPVTKDRLHSSMLWGDY